jgi:dihydrolipoamide dehydrogenase
LAETIFDVAIIGGGPAGYTAAIRAGQYGLKTALINDNEKLGGTCLLWGCIPTKSLLFDAEVYDHFKHAKEYGIDVSGEVKVNWPTVLQRKNDIIAPATAS